MALVLGGCAGPGAPTSVPTAGDVVVETLTVTQTQSPPEAPALRSDCGVVVAARFAEVVAADRLLAVVSLRATGTDRWFSAPVGLLAGDPGLRTPFLWIAERYGDSFDRVRLQVLGPDGGPSVIGSAPVQVTCPHEGSPDTWAGLSGRITSVSLRYSPTGYGYPPDVHCAVQATARVADLPEGYTVSFRLHSQVWGTWYVIRHDAIPGARRVQSLPVGVRDGYGDTFDRVTAVLTTGDPGAVVDVESASVSVGCPWRPDGG